MARKKRSDYSKEMQNLMDEFCNIVMPGHNKAKGYINVKQKVEALNVDARTYYHWKKMESIPRIKDMMSRLNERGYTLKITLKDDAFND